MHTAFITRPLMHIFIVWTSLFVSTLFRRSVPLGLPLGDDYQVFEWTLVGVMLGVVLVTDLLALPLRRAPRFLARWFTPWQSINLSLLVLALLMLRFFPDVSQLQLIYFYVIGWLLGALYVAIPGQLRAYAFTPVDMWEWLAALVRYRFLISTWLGYRIRSRYSQTALGIAWVVLMPLTSSLVLAFALTQLLGIRTPDVPFVLFLLSGAVIFSVFQSVVLPSTSIIAANGGVIGQIAFPREIILLLVVGEMLVDFFFQFLALLVVGLFFGYLPNVYYLLLPIPVFIMVMLAVGTGFLVSWISLVVRDFQQLVGVVMQLLLYTTIFYAQGSVANYLEFLRLINPLQAVAEAFRDIVLYGNQPPLLELIPAALMSFGILYVGYLTFKVNEDLFADYV